MDQFVQARTTLHARLVEQKTDYAGNTLDHSPHDQHEVSYAVRATTTPATNLPCFLAQFRSDSIGVFSQTEMFYRQVV